MTKTFSVLVLVFGGFWGGSQAMASPVTPASLCSAVAGNLVANCGFETGSFTSWTIGGNTDNPGNNYYGVDAFDANSGSFGAYMSEDSIDGGTSPVTLSQTLSTVAGGMYTVSFWLDQDTPPFADGTHAFAASFGATTMLDLMPTVAATGPVGTWTEYTYTETAIGASTALTFAFQNDDDDWSFDDVSVTTSVATTPEPSTWLLAGMALGALFLVKRVLPGERTHPV